jgi:hypothetical protein
MAATKAVEPKSCELARVAEEALIVAQIALPAGGAFNADATAQLLTAVPQISAYVETQIAAFCK